MATTTLVPNAEGTTIEWTPKSGTDNSAMVDEGIAGADDTTTENSVALTTSATLYEDWYALGDTPSDFSACIDYTLTGRVKQAGWVDDTFSIRTSIWESNEITEVAVATVLIDQSTPPPTSYTTVTGAAVNNTSNKTAWDSRKLQVRSSRISSGMADTITSYCTAVEVVLNYTAGGAAIDGALKGVGTLASTFVPHIPITANLARYDGSYTWR